jgi:hypothetical protein
MTMAQIETPSKRLTRAMCEEYLELTTKASMLERQARRARSDAGGIAKEAIVPHIKKNGGRQRQCAFAGFALSIVTERGRVAWADAYERDVGFEEAETLRANPPMAERLKVARV